MAWVGSVTLRSLAAAPAAATAAGLFVAGIVVLVGARKL